MKKIVLYLLFFSNSDFENRVLMDEDHLSQIVFVLVTSLGQRLKYYFLIWSLTLGLPAIFVQLSGTVGNSLHLARIRGDHLRSFFTTI